MSLTTSDVITQIRGLIKDLLKTDGRNFFSYDSSASFSLSELNINSASIKVYLNGTELDTDDWSYNSTTNKVTISPVTSGVSLVKNDDIIITFSYYDKYSDTEITSYIKSNLIWFTRKKYGKRFYMNANDEIVTQDGINPDEEEGDIIAQITAIDIDPQNVDINIDRTFKVTATEKMSKTEQINLVLDQFMRSFGTIDFLEKEI